jgi:plasmid stabilization system protein ParE
VPRFLLRPAAEADIALAFEWYELQREGLGLEFLNAVEAGLALVRRSPLMFPVVYRDTRRALLRKFPYSLYYVSTLAATRVIACAHVRQSAALWKERSDAEAGDT